MSPIPAEMVERAARAAYDAVPHNKQYDKLSAFQKDRLKNQVLGMLAALGDTHVMVPKIPERERLISMALRDDHAFGAPVQEVFPGVKMGLTDAERESRLVTMSQIYEEATGQGFYTPEGKDYYHRFAPASGSQG